MNFLNRRHLLAFLASLPALPAAAQAAGQRVIVVGAGVAGLAAAEALTRRGAEVTVLEARPRIGGRAVTDSSNFEGNPFDLGAAWLTGGDANPLAARFAAADLPAKAQPDSRLVIANGRRFNATQLDKLNEFEANLQKTIDASAEQRLTLERLRAQDVDEHLALTLAGPNTFGRELAELDPPDMLQLGKAMSGKLLYPAGGMGKAISTLFKGVPVKLGTPVSEIDYRGQEVAVITGKGDRLTADAVIVTVSTGILASGKIRFTPALPGRYQQAIEHLPMGLVNRIGLQFSTDIFGGALPDLTRLNAVTSGGAVIDASVRQGSEKMIVFTVGGKLARQLEGQSEASALNYALSGLVDLFGSNVERAFVRGKASRWGLEPWTLGSIAVAAPRKAEARSTLAAPLNTLYFAGEALGSAWAGTLAGAYISGREAAAKVMGLSVDDDEAAPRRTSRRRTNPPRPGNGNTPADGQEDQGTVIQPMVPYDEYDQR